MRFVATLAVWYHQIMTAKALARKVERLEREIRSLREPRHVFGKTRVDEALLKKAGEALFRFDIEEFVSRKDLGNLRHTR